MIHVITGIIVLIFSVFFLKAENNNTELKGNMIFLIIVTLFLSYGVVGFACTFSEKVDILEIKEISKLSTVLVIVASDDKLLEYDDIASYNKDLSKYNIERTIPHNLYGFNVKIYSYKLIAKE